MKIREEAGPTNKHPRKALPSGGRLGWQAGLDESSFGERPGKEAELPSLRLANTVSKHQLAQTVPRINVLVASLQIPVCARWGSRETEASWWSTLGNEKEKEDFRLFSRFFFDIQLWIFKYQGFNGKIFKVDSHAWNIFVSNKERGNRFVTVTKKKIWKKKKSVYHRSV